jgi:hypothetical protein
VGLDATMVVVAIAASNGSRSFPSSLDGIGRGDGGLLEEAVVNILVCVCENFLEPLKTKF